MGISPANLANLKVLERLDLTSDFWDSMEASADLPPLDIL
ncbi:hypothetical protein BH11PSE3_BH11PSE3_32740 [soil metagenome]